MKAKFLIKGLIKNIPGIECVYDFHKSSGGTCNSRYCYSVWLRHLVHSYHNGIKIIPETVAELGPGDSLGIGIAALISGVKSYFALDLIKYSDSEINLKIFDELVGLFKNKKPIPDSTEFPLIKPNLDNYDFPSNILSDLHLIDVLNNKRLDKIRKEITHLECPENKIISYFAPWTKASIINYECVNMILSQAVLEHVDDLRQIYESMYKWLKPDGFMSHTIDFKSHGTSNKWNGHWTYSDLEWNIVRGRKKYLLNREPYSTHINLLKKNNFKIICDIKTYSNSEIKKKNLSKRFNFFSNEDLLISSVFLQAIKK